MLISVSLTGGVSDVAQWGEDAERVEFEIYKRTFDIIVSLALLILLSPIFILVALAVGLSSQGPIIYRQRRLTKDGRVFVMLKFRSMYRNAERNVGAVWAQQGDPRVTPVGKFLRQTRLDELPQLINVLKDEMSLIGPRPERPELAESLARELPFFNQRMTVKAGITGLAQVQSGYADSMEQYEEKLRYDIEYIRHRSMRLDLKIALQTIKVVITGAGAQ